ncbi:MAG: hypothetical protein MHM6MM_000396 [Cercozoa sp. M6MM]
MLRAMLALAAVASAAATVFVRGESSYVPSEGPVAIASLHPTHLTQFFATAQTEKNPESIDSAVRTPFPVYGPMLRGIRMALEDMNNKTLNPQFLPNHQIELPEFNNSGGIALRAAEATLNVVNQLYWVDRFAQTGIRNSSDPSQPKTIIGVHGPSYADPTSVSAVFLSAASVVQVSTLVPAADLSDASKYPFLVRLRGPEQSQARAILDLLLAVNLRRVALLHSNDIYGNSVHANLAEARKERGAVADDFDLAYKAAVPLSRFLDKTSDTYAMAEQQMRDHLRYVVEQQIRIVLLWTTTGDDALLYDIVAKDEKEGGEFADFFTSHKHLVIAPADWPAFAGVARKKRPGTLALTFPSQMSLKDNNDLYEVDLWTRDGNSKRSLFLRSKKDFHDRLHGLFGNDTEFSTISTGFHFAVEAAYDATIIMALAFDELIERNRTATGEEATKMQAKMSRLKPFGRAMHAAIKTKKFVGHSGYVELDPFLDRKPQYGISAWQSNALWSGDFEVFGHWDVDTNSIVLTDADRNVIARGDGTNEDETKLLRSLIKVDFGTEANNGLPSDNGVLPADGPQEIRTLKQVSISALGVVLGVMGLVASLFVFVHINTNREVRYVKMGAPNIQSLQLVGLMLAFTTLLYLHMDSQRLESSSEAKAVCRAFFWTENLSFAIVFGALLAKALRVYIIFTRNDWTTVRVTDKQLAVVVALIVAVATVIMLVFDVGYDAIEVENIEKTQYYSPALDANIHEFTERCRINGDYDATYYGFTLGFQSVLMLAGLWLANELRGVNIPALNDSADVRQTMVLVFVIALLTKPTQLLVESDDPRSVYVLTVLSTFLLNFSTLLYLFAGRVYNVLKGNHEFKTGTMSSIGTSNVSRHGVDSGKKSGQTSTGDEIRLAIKSKSGSSRGSTGTSRTSTTNSTRTNSTHSTASSNSSVQDGEAGGIAMASLPAHNDEGSAGAATSV